MMRNQTLQRQYQYKDYTNLPKFKKKEDGSFEVEGTKDNDFIILPEGHGAVKSKGKVDEIIFEEGRFFEHTDFDQVYDPVNDYFLKQLEKKEDSWFLKLLEKITKNSGKEVERKIKDKITVFIQEDKEAVQSVEYFKVGEMTYIQIFDKDKNEVVGALKIQGDFNHIEIRGFDGIISTQPTQIYRGNEEAASMAGKELDEKIVRGTSNELGRALKNSSENLQPDESDNNINLPSGSKNKVPHK